MTTSEDSLGKIPEFLALSDKGQLDLPNQVIWKGIQLDEDELIIYIDEKGEQSMVTQSPFDDEKFYRVTVIDHS